MRFKAVLFDLDDTLLGNPMDAFLPRYIPAVAAHAMTLIPDQSFDFVPHLLKATRVMTGNTDPAHTNDEIFWHVLKQETGIDWIGLGARDHFDRYYGNGFEEIRTVTTQQQTAVDMVEWVQEQGAKVVIATNPLFPKSAIEARLRWAGLSVTDYDFDLVTYAENMHATKPQVAYYEEILACIGCDAADAVMVGDSWKNDIEPTAVLNMANFWIVTNEPEPPTQDILGGYGSLDDFFNALKNNHL